MSDRLADIKTIWTDKHAAIRTISPENVDWLILELEQLRDAYEHSGKTIEAYSERLTRAEAEIEKLQERCEAYKGQVRAGGDEIERLKAGVLKVVDESLPIGGMDDE